MMTKGHVLLLFLIIASTGNIYAQQTTQLTLNDAIQLSLANSKQLKLSQAKIAEAVSATREAVEGRLPDVGVSGSYLRVSKPNIKIKTASSGSGGDSSAISPVNVTQAAYGMANVSLNLFSGLKVKYGIESARYLEEAAKLDETSNRQGVILNTIAAYINLYKAIAGEKIVQENIERSRKRDADFANFERNGLLARNDLLKAQIQTSNLELSLVDAQNNIRLSTVNMNLMLGLPENTSLSLDTALADTTRELQSVEDFEKLALQNRSDAKALEMRQKASLARVKIAKGDYYPGIALTGGYLAAYIPKFLTITNALNFGIGFRYSLSSLWKTNSKVEQAKAREQQLLANEAMLDDEIRLSINKAYYDYLAARKKIEVYTKSLEQASENYRISQNKYNNNLLTLTDLLDADVSQLQAKLNLEFAKADVLLAYETLLQKAGILNDRL
jgi:outer membrane protein